MTKVLALLLISWLCVSPTGVPNAVAGPGQDAPRKFEVVYDQTKDKTTVRLAPVQISGAKDKYHSVHIAPAFSFPGREPRVPEIIDFELRTVVKAKLKIDLYVLFIVDGEEIFLSSNRWAEKKGNLGRGWMGEHLVFRMPYETFLKLTKANRAEIKLDGISFPMDEETRKTLKEFARRIEARSFDTN